MARRGEFVTRKFVKIIVVEEIGLQSKRFVRKS